ncbi:hypothetical protein AB0I81_51565 [Nonomuraea sp. NPDC050404]|uniref:hypothetical protein n=1 Tax=Nonomuraea sp. NPDC050404 TaxID=3155783 RepID=UPI0033C2AD5B
MNLDPMPQLSRLVIDLRRHPDIEVVKEWGRFVEPIDDPAADYDLRWQRTQEAATSAVPGCELDPALRPLTDRLVAGREDRVGVAWRYRLDGVEHNGGEFCWVTPAPPIRAPAWWNDLPAELRDLHERLCVLEYHPRAGDGVAVMLELRAGSAPLWLEHRGQLFPLSIGVAEYFERAIEMRGVFGWQALYCDWKDQLDSTHERLADLRQLFP